MWTKTDRKSDTQIINIQEKSWEDKGSQEQAIIALTSLPTTSFPYGEETKKSPVSSTSQIATQHNLFSRYKETKKKKWSIEVYYIHRILEADFYYSTQDIVCTWHREGIVPIRIIGTYSSNP